MSTIVKYLTKARQQVTAELNEDQKQKVDRWLTDASSDRVSFAETAMDGKSRISIPLKNAPTDFKYISFVRVQLNKDGYELEDYQKGTASKPGDKRIFSIGKILTKQAEKRVKERLISEPGVILKDELGTLDLFNKDPGRQAKDSNSLHVIITNNPYDIAGVSTDRGWSSCMNMDDGMYREKLPFDIKEGTHAAYLVYKTDTDIQHPLARISLKPFKDKFSDDKILVPEEKVYGTAKGDFLDTVTQWAEKNFAPKDEGFYKISPDVYNDTSVPNKVGKNALKNLINDGDYDTISECVNYQNGQDISFDPNLTEDDKLRLFINVNNMEFRNAMVHTGFINADRISRCCKLKNNDILVNTNSISVKGFLMNSTQKHALTDEDKQVLATDPNVQVRERFVVEEVWPSDKIDEAFKDDPSEYIRANVASKTYDRDTLIHIANNNIHVNDTIQKNVLWNRNVINTGDIIYHSPSFDKNADFNNRITQLVIQHGSDTLKLEFIKKELEKPEINYGHIAVLVSVMRSTHNMDKAEVMIGAKSDVPTQAKEAFRHSRHRLNVADTSVRVHADVYGAGLNDHSDYWRKRIHETTNLEALVHLAKMLPDDEALQRVAYDRHRYLVQHHV